VSAYPIVLEGSAVSAVIVGGGPVALRKATALLNAGARVHVVAPEVVPELESLADERSDLRVTVALYETSHLIGATLVIAATNDIALNAAVARDAAEKGKLVNVVNAPELGSFVTPAVHRAGDVIVAVSAGRVPAAAARIRDAIAESIDGRYGDAVRELASLRRSLIDAGQRDRWRDASAALIGDDFTERVESGEITARAGAWR
jgi:precorrin-2 dehydrogenase/sirohydrochlorin ferrochelatase